MWELRERVTKKIIVSAHLDEIGGTIRKICDDGRLKFSKRGSYEDGLVSGKKIKIRTSSNKWINGIIEGRSFHAINEKYRSKYPNLLEDSYIYLGAESKDEIIMWDIHVGAPFVFDEPFGYLGKSNNIISGKSLDDLVGITALTVLLKEITKERDIEHDIYIVGTVREEIGSEGALYVAKEINPNHFISLDIAYATEKSSSIETDNNVEFSDKPVIVWQDSSGIGVYDSKICEFVKHVSQSIDMETQDGVFEYYSSDAQQVQKNCGIPSICLGIPIKYSHYPPEVVNLKSILNMSYLVKSVIMAYHGVI